MSFKINIENPVHAFLSGAAFNCLLGQINDAVLIPMTFDIHGDWVRTDRLVSLGIAAEALIGTAAIYMVLKQKQSRRAFVSAALFFAGSVIGLEASDKITLMTQGYNWEDYVPLDQSKVFGSVRIPQLEKSSPKLG